MTVLCCGLLTLDHLLWVSHVPGANEKMVASDALLEFGGPAANAAATASVLGGIARLVTAVGDGPLTTVVTAQLAEAGVEVVDLLTGRPGSPAVSTVLITESTGERAVVSLNASKVTAVPAPEPALLDGVDLLLADGHHLEVAVALAAEAGRRGVPVLLDGGSWKPGTQRLLPHVDVALLSADFRTPEASDPLAHCLAQGCTIAAQTHGDQPIRVRTATDAYEVPVPQVDDVNDTLGAGDVIHGTLAKLLAERGLGSFRESLADAAAVASESTRHRGAHGWWPRG